MPASKIKEYLDKNRIKYEVITHPLAYTAQGVAAAAHIAGKDPDCEPGAEPPFGNLYGIDTIVSDTLSEDEQIAFNAGTHTECIRLAYRDYAKLVRPKVARIAT
jgi:Ala-tRNA(Pro) deacylase